MMMSEGRLQARKATSPPSAPARYTPTAVAMIDVLGPGRALPRASRSANS